MSKLQCSIDINQVVCENEIYYWIEGWGVSPQGGKTAVTIKADGTDVPCYIQKIERPDVRQNLDLPGNNSDIGFKILIHNIVELCAGHRRLELYLGSSGLKKCVWRKSLKEIRDEYHHETLSYKIDVVEQTEKMVIIQGWVLNRYKDFSLAVEGVKGERVPHKIKQMVRKDVNRMYQLPADYRGGFHVLIPREVKSRLVKIIISNDVTQKEYLADMKKIAVENSRRGKMAHLLSFERRSENLSYIQKHGLNGFVSQLKREIEPAYEDYDTWMKEQKITRRSLKLQRSVSFSYNPLISVVIPLYNTPLNFLKEIIDSLLNQSYGKFEVCLADGSSQDAVGAFIQKRYHRDKRIIYKRLKENLGISMNTNAALEMASGEFIMLSDHDDILEPDALFEMVKALNEDPALDIIYTDEDKIDLDGKKYYDPNFKPDFNIDLLRSNNYICHIFFVRRTIVEQAGVFRKEFDGAQDFDFILRCSEQTNHIGHIAKVLYHWRSHPNSTAGNPGSKQYAVDAGRRSVEQHYARVGIDAKVEATDIFGIYRTINKLKGEPKISIVIPNKDHIDDLSKCITSIIERSTYQNYEIIVVENNSEEAETFTYYEEIQSKFDCVRVLTWEREFNYAGINNFGAAAANGEYLLLLNNDVEVITPDWMEEMLGYCQRDDVGIVGAKLYYPDDTVQHAGVIVGMGGVAGHIFSKFPRESYGYCARLATPQNLSAVTAACLMISAADFKVIGGFDEKFAVAFNDVDFCLKIRDLDKVVVFNPYVELYHYESKSRGAEDTQEKKKRFWKEIELFESKWGEILKAGDPYYNKNLSLTKGDCSLRDGIKRLAKDEEEAGGR